MLRKSYSKFKYIVTPDMDRILNKIMSNKYSLYELKQRGVISFPIMEQTPQRFEEIIFYTF